MSAEMALAGASLTHRARQFPDRLAHQDRRNAGSAMALLWLARLAGHSEAALTSGQLDMVLSALSDAAVYRNSGAAVLGCWDCENIPGGRCADHAGDADTARAYADLASVLSSGLTVRSGRAVEESAGCRSRAVAASHHRRYVRRAPDLAT